MIFYSDNENFYEKVLEKIKNSFKNLGKIERNFKDYEKCLMKKILKKNIIKKIL